MHMGVPQAWLGGGVHAHQGVHAHVDLCTWGWGSVQVRIPEGSPGFAGVGGPCTWGSVHWGQGAVQLGVLPPSPGLTQALPAGLRAPAGQMEPNPG